MAVETTVTSAKAWSPDVIGFPARDVIPEALILQTSTVAGFVEGDEPAVRVPYVDDAAAVFKAEGATLDEADPALSEVLVYTAKVTQLVRLSREQFTQTGTADLLSESVRRAVTKAANIAYLAQPAPTPPAVQPAAGLLNVSGIENGGAVATNLDALIDLFATIEGNSGSPSHILMSPDAWAALRQFKTATDSELGILGAGVNDTQRMLLDVPVIVTPAMTSLTGLVVDKMAVVSAVGNVNVSQSEHVYFTSDSIALRCTWRFGQNVVRPDRIGKFTITPPA